MLVAIMADMEPHAGMAFIYNSTVKDLTVDRLGEWLNKIDDGTAHREFITETLYPRRFTNANVLDRMIAGAKELQA